MDRTLSRLTRLAVDPARPTDGGLVDAFLTGRDAGAFEALVRRHGPMVLAVCRRVLRHHHDAEDAFQATFLVLARRAAGVWPRDAVGSWLYGVAYRVALKARATRGRRVARVRPLDESDHPVVGEQPDPDLAAAVDRAIRKLPEVYRAAVVACDLEGRTRKEAAEQLGWKEGTLSGRLARAREILAARLRRAGHALPAGGVAAALGTGTTAEAVPPDLCVRVVSFAAKTSTVGVSGPVAALTEGVVRTMFLTKLKAAAVAVLATGVIGFGAWASAGAGDEPGPGPGPTPGNAETRLADQKARLDALRKKLDEAEKELEKETARAKAGDSPPSAKMTADLEPLQGRWRVDSIGSAKMDDVPEGTRPPPVEIRANTLSMPFRDAAAGWKRTDYKIAVDGSQSPKTIDLIAPGKPVGRGIYEFEKAPGGATLLRLTVGAIRPADFKPDGSGVTIFCLVRLPDEKPPAPQSGRLDRLTVETAQKAAAEAAVVADAARREVEVARVNVVHAQNVVAAATAKLRQAEANLDAAKKAAAELERKAVPKDKPAPPGKKPTYTVHVRTPTAPEEVIWTENEGTDTVLDALTRAGKAVPLIRGPDALAVWVLREKEVLPVDLGGIVNWNRTATNYALKPGDRVFVQVKVGK